MNRREVREHLFRMLFLKEFHTEEDLEEQINLYYEWIEDFEQKQKELTYLTDKYKKILEKLENIDIEIEEVSKGWKLNRMAKVDLSILRLAVFEIQYDEEIPTKVAINEAVEIAKKFGGENSSRFINGILAKFA